MFKSANGHRMGSRIAIFGASVAGRRAFDALGKRSAFSAFIDNDPLKWGQSFCGLPVYSPDRLPNLDCQTVLIASDRAPQIYDQLIGMGWPRSGIEIDRSPSDQLAHNEWKESHSHRLAGFRDRHRDEGCFIVGNGPSLNTMDLSPLVDYTTFGLNKIHLIFSRSSFRPKYHVAVNSLVVEQSWDDFQNLSCPSFISHVAARGKFDNSSSGLVHLISTSHTHGFSKDASEILCEGSTVTYVAIQLAWYMGFRRVFLIGVDHSFQTVGLPNETKRMEGADPNHFDPSYFANKDWQLPDLAGSEFDYRLAKRVFAESDPSRVLYDATRGGALEVFEKIDYEEALISCPKAGEPI